MTGKISEDPDVALDGTEKWAVERGGQNYGPLSTSLATWLASLPQALTNKTINAANNAISNITTAMFAPNAVDTDPTLAANSDTRLASQKAAKAYADTKLGDAPNDGNYYARRSAAWASITLPREKLTAPRTYFINPATGIDTNNGLAAGTAFQTIQKAIDTINTLDLAGFDVTIQCAASTAYATAIVSSPWLGKGTVTLVGDVTTPANCQINSTSVECVLVTGVGSRISLKGLKISNSSSSAAGLSSQLGGTLTIADKMEFGRCAFATVQANNGGTVLWAPVAAPGHSINAAGTQSGFCWTQGGGASQQTQGAVNFKFNSALTVSSSFFHCSTAANAVVPSMAFDTSTFGVTGKRFNSDNLALLQTFSGSLTYFPGTVAGTCSLPLGSPLVSPYGLYA